MNEFSGLVRDRKFIALSGSARRLTSIQPQESVSPESREIDLSGLEGKYIKVEGVEQGDWIFAARVATSAQYFRANVGIVLTNPKGQILALERAKEVDGADGKKAYEGTDEWQMAQGGLDELEEPRDASERELEEELGPTVRRKSVFVYEHPEWLAYELPPEARKAKHGRGQVQKWFVYRFSGEDADIDLSGHGYEREFMRFQWIALSKLAEITWEVRQPIYRRLAKDFAEYFGET